MRDFTYQAPFPLGKDETRYRLDQNSQRFVSVAHLDGLEVLKVDPEGLASQALREVSFLLRPEHNKQVARILTDPEASPNDRGVALAF